MYHLVHFIGGVSEHIRASSAEYERHFTAFNARYIITELCNTFPKTASSLSSPWEIQEQTLDPNSIQAYGVITDQSDMEFIGHTAICED